MDYLARESAPFSPETWEKIDSTVIDNAKKHMVCRRFLNIYGPLGPGASTGALYLGKVTVCKNAVSIKPPRYGY